PRSIVFGVDELNAICPWSDVEGAGLSEVEEHWPGGVQQGVDPPRAVGGDQVEIGHAASIGQPHVVSPISASLASDCDSRARPGACRKPRGTPYTGSGREGVLLFFPEVRSVAARPLEARRWAETRGDRRLNRC